VSVADRGAANSDEGNPTAATPPKSWPNLDLDRLPGLDYLVLEIMSEDLRYAASLVESLFQHPSARGIAEVLRRFADTPRAIKYANQSRDHTPDPILGLWRALHYLITAELHPRVPRGKLLGIVADIWAPLKDRTIEADISKHGSRAKQILQSIVEDRFKHAAMDRSQVIAALDRDLKQKAAAEPPRATGQTTRGKSRKIARKK
jgi:hypothetical protein